MGKRSSVNKLPPEVRNWLDKALVERNFTGYQALTDELKVRGYQISKTAIFRHGKEFEDRLGMLRAMTDQARAIVEATPDDAGMISEALTRVVQHKAMEVLSTLNAAELDPSKVNLPALGRMIADLGRSSVTQKKWMIEVQERVQVAAKNVERVARAAGNSEEVVQQVIGQILGIAPPTSRPSTEGAAQSV